MNLSPAPFGLDELTTAPLPPSAPRTPIKVATGPDRTECNYLVMFFVLGVFLLAFMDSV
jgi:hypothetical protein